MVRNAQPADVVQHGRCLQSCHFLFRKREGARDGKGTLFHTLYMPNVVGVACVYGTCKRLDGGETELLPARLLHLELRFPITLLTSRSATCGKAPSKPAAQQSDHREGAFRRHQNNRQGLSPNM